jgi:hypothetical protein
LGKARRSVLNRLGAEALLALIELSGYDWDLFVDVRWRLLRSLATGKRETLPPLIRVKEKGLLVDGDACSLPNRVIAAAFACFDDRYAISGVAYEDASEILGRWLFVGGAHRKALKVLTAGYHSKAGVSRGIRAECAFLAGLCQSRITEIEFQSNVAPTFPDTREWISRCLSLKPAHAGAQRWERRNSCAGRVHKCK